MTVIHTGKPTFMQSYIYLSAQPAVIENVLSFCDADTVVLMWRFTVYIFLVVSCRAPGMPPGGMAQVPQHPQSSFYSSQQPLQQTGFYQAQQAASTLQVGVVAVSTGYCQC